MALLLSRARTRNVWNNLFSKYFTFSCSTHVLDITPDGRKLELTTQTGQVENERKADTQTTASYHGVWLRHNCRCPDCYSASTNMIKLRISQVSECKELQSAWIKDSKVFVKWRNTDHQGVFPLEWLKNNDYSSEERRRKRHTPLQPLVADSFPVSDFTEIISSDEGLYRWLRDVNYYGVSMIKGIEEPETAPLKLAEKFPNLLNYFGEIYKVVHREDVDDLGEGTGELMLHQDLLYYENPPGLELFNCVRFDPCIEGGESIIVDLYPVVEELRVNHPEHFKILASTPVTFQREILGSHEDFNLRMTRSHIQLDRFGQVEAINWNLAHCEPLCIDEDQVEKYYSALSLMEKLIEDPKRKLHHRLVPGECLAFNNRRVVHGRAGFHPNGGQRHFNGFYAHTDYIRSMFLVLGRKLGKNEPSANVFMSSFK